MKQKRYLKIYEQMRQKITEGTYSYGSLLPSKRDAAQDYGVSLVTVEHAYDLLSEEGYINALERKGYVVIYQEKDFFPVPPKKEVISAPSYMADDEMFPYSVYVRTMRKVLSDYGEAVMMRRESQGLIELRSALASYLARSRSMYVDPDQIIITAGAEAAYAMIVAMLGRYRIYGVEDPSYEKIVRMYQSDGVRIDLLKMGSNGIQSSELERTPASVLHVTPFTSYPTGVTADAGKRKEYILWAKQKNAYIVEDDFASEYSPSTKNEETLFAMEPERTVIYVNSFTKTICPAMRISYVVLPKNRRNDMIRSVSDWVCGVSAPEQLMVAAILNNGSFERHLNKVKRGRRKLAKQK